MYEVNVLRRHRAQYPVHSMTYKDFRNKFVHCFFASKFRYGEGLAEAGDHPKPYFCCWYCQLSIYRGAGPGEGREANKIPRQTTPGSTESAMAGRAGAISRKSPARASGLRFAPCRD